MGFKFFSCNSLKCIECNKTTGPNPNPSKYTLKKILHIKKYTILYINYTGCINYKGNKILVFKSKELCNKIVFQKSKIDPHFSENGVSPIARFIPTNEGWEMAINFCNSIEN